MFTINGILSTSPTIDSDTFLKSFPKYVNSKICQPYGEPAAQAIHLQRTTSYLERKQKEKTSGFSIQHQIIGGSGTPKHVREAEPLSSAMLPDLKKIDEKLYLHVKARFYFKGFQHSDANEKNLYISWHVIKNQVKFVADCADEALAG
ncbi:44875_t:CDS:2 [Gigaspora margarita]|uniref:44875_t:CDS:1 n=1 Tax=Gigaspora margarita TaxID=4874 RepID=A0ABN7W768_GIGMA|nr:44875_t:CDS:2 [Gigaspora margarita]